MKILVVGGGGREHAIIRSLKKNPHVETIFALPGNGGIAADAVCVNIGATDIDKIVAFAAENALLNSSGSEHIDANLKLKPPLCLKLSSLTEEKKSPGPRKNRSFSAISYPS